MVFLLFPPQNKLGKSFFFFFSLGFSDSQTSQSHGMSPFLLALLSLTLYDALKEFECCLVKQGFLVPGWVFYRLARAPWQGFDKGTDSTHPDLFQEPTKNATGNLLQKSHFLNILQSICAEFLIIQLGTPTPTSILTRTTFDLCLST